MAAVKKTKRPAKKLQTAAPVAKVAKNSNWGSRPGERRGGRKKGTPNKRTAALVRSVEETGITPLGYMLTVMRSPVENKMSDAAKIALIGLKFEAAKAAANYVHPKLSAIEHTGKDGDALIPGRITVEFVENSARR